MSAAIFGNVSSIMLRVYQGTEEFHEKQTSIKEFIHFHHIPKPLANRLIESYQHARSFTNGVDTNSVSVHRQRRQSGLKSGVVDPGQQNFDFSKQISEKFRFFQAISQKKSIFPGKFSKNVDFFRQFKNNLDFPGKNCS